MVRDNNIALDLDAVRETAVEERQAMDDFLQEQGIMVDSIEEAEAMLMDMEAGLDESLDLLESANDIALGHPRGRSQDMDMDRDVETAEQELDF